MSGGSDWSAPVMFRRLVSRNVASSARRRLVGDVRKLQHRLFSRTASQTSTTRLTSVAGIAAVAAVGVGVGVSVAVADSPEQFIQLYSVALESRREKFGDLHEQTLSAVHSLAQAYASAKQYEQAARYFREAFAGRLELIGPNHPDTLETVHQLAGVEAILGNKKQAAMLYHHAMRGRLHRFGIKDRRTQATVVNYADLLWTV